jgi:hypothetical protein
MITNTDLIAVVIALMSAGIVLAVALRKNYLLEQENANLKRRIKILKKEKD